MGSMHARLDFLWAFLGTRLSRLRDARRHKDLGASAVELAIITAVIIGIAGIVLAAINIFVSNESAKISGG
jgi:Flp pilus assembly protein TadG